MKRTMLIIILIFLLCWPTMAGEAGAFLDNPAGARQVGMSGAQVAVISDGYAPLWNPAGLAYLKKTELNSMLASVFGVVDQKYFSYAQIMPWGVISLGVFSSGVADIEGSAYVNGRSIRTGRSFAYSASAWILSYGATLARINETLHKDILTPYADDLSLGANLKLIGETLDNASSSGYALDLGVQYDYSPVLKLGVTVKNFVASPVQWTGGGMTGTDLLPMLVNLGLGYYLESNWLTAFDLEMRNTQRAKFHLGTEYRLIFEDPQQKKEERKEDTYAMLLRGGLSDASYDLGLGLVYHEILFDYAYSSAQYDYMQTTHRFSLGYRFDGPKVKPRIIAQLPQPPAPQIAVVVTEDEAIDFQQLLKQALAKRQAEQLVVKKNTAQQVPQIATVNIQPQLILEMPETNALATQSKYGVRGKTVDVKTLLINGEPIWINAQGYFYAEIPVSRGQNEIVFKGYSVSNDLIKLTRTINRIK
ncbi:MAG: hypothetical protein WC838_02750 [Candidatus Margulisiibacteriota bacterium]|jgi:hypothetical protein